ncbi:MAG: hypothetical protein M1837_000247 [Sclerophora amabilis]|nr:MAG: hypothetical protein M1837_000247 [Sclerophora amabilis]
MKLFQFMRTPKKEDFSYLDPSSEEDLLASFSSPRPPRRVRKRKLEDWITSRVRLTRVLPGLRPDDANDRSPPPPPTSLDFPTWAPKAEITPFTEAASERIHTQFASLRGVAGIRDEHLEALNLTCEGEVPFETLIPDNSFLPPREGAQQTSPAKSPNARLNNGKEAPGIEIFHTRSADVLLENDDAFRALTRRPPREGRSAVKLGHFYKFWQGLELMSQYWDSSLDNYYEEDVVIENGDKNQDGEPMDVDGTKKRRREKYTGRRLGNGKDMPDLYREDTVRGFIEPIAWLFGCHVL